MTTPTEQTTPQVTRVRYGKFAEAVQREIRHARIKHRSIYSQHEGYAVLLEEVRELEAEVFRKARSDLSVLKELVQVAAMCQRMAEDCDLIMDGERIGRTPDSVDDAQGNPVVGRLADDDETIQAIREAAWDGPPRPLLTTAAAGYYRRLIAGVNELLAANATPADVEGHATGHQCAAEWRDKCRAVEKERDELLAKLGAIRSILDQLTTGGA